MVLPKDGFLVDDKPMLKVNTTTVAVREPVSARRTRLRIITIALAFSLLLWHWNSAPVKPKSPAAAVAIDPADDWKDEWPFREQEPWDISTDFPYPRTLKYEVEEGTWLRLDVHPKSGEIVFDMLGDIYCLSPGSSQAHPILLGIPMDGDPRFNLNGNLLAFRSDAGLGVDNIWVTQWSSCSEAALRPHRDLDLHGSSLSSELLQSLALQEEDEALLNTGVKETEDRKRRRLLREGRLNAWRITNETYRFVTEPKFHPDGESVIATKWYTSGRSIGAGEGWQYTIPKQGEQVSAGAGKRVVSRVLPPGWSKEQYGDQQIGSEQFLWQGSDSLIYAKKIVQENDGVFSYSGDVHSGLYAIFSKNLTTGQIETLVPAFPGGASRPVLSRDGSTLAFVRRVRDKEALVLMNLRSGTLHHLWYGLTYDTTSIFSPMGTYPSFSFAPDDSSIVIWAAGKLWRVPVKEDSRGEKVSGGDPEIIPYKASIEKRLAETGRPSTDIRRTELADKQRVYAFKGLKADTTGENVVFQAAGATYLQKVGSSSSPTRIPVLDPSAAYYSPSFVPNTSQAVLQAKWSESNFTSFELGYTETKTVYQIVGIPLGRYISPTISGGSGESRKLAFIRLPGDPLTGDIVETRNTGIYVADITLPQQNAQSVSSVITVSNLQLIPSDIRLWEVSRLSLQFIHGSSALLLQDYSRTSVIELASGPDQFGEYSQEALATGKTAPQVTVSPVISNKKNGKAGYAVHDAAFLDFYHVYYVSGSNLDGEPLRSKPGDSTPGIQRLSLDGGHDLTWSGDGKRLFWLLGPMLHYVDVKSSGEVSSTKWEEVEVLFESDVTRLKKDIKAITSKDSLNADVVAIVNASVLTMQAGKFESDFIDNGILLYQDGEISAVGKSGSVDIPTGAHVINAQGGLIVPGFIDVHAHWVGFMSQIPTTSWELETFLAYGVTTLHNPSSDNRDGYHERFLVESGNMVGPRIFHTGSVIYGGGLAELHQDVVNMQEAKSALIRVKAEGGPSSFSYKNYQLPIRASRQRLLLAARELGMFSVPEGGMNLDWDLTYIIDGMATIEHAIPIPVLHEDILTLYALSGTAATPTHIVNYGGVMGEQLLWATHDIVNDPKLRHLTRHDTLESLEETTKRPMDSFALFNTSASVAELVKRGAWANIGAHGEAPLGLMYHTEMQFTMAGGLDAYEVLRAATRDGALSLGLFDAIGSLTPGKLADIVLYPPGVDIAALKDLKASKDPLSVIRGGRIYDAATMIEDWPVKGRKQAKPSLNAD